MQRKLLLVNPSDGAFNTAQHWSSRAAAVCSLGAIEANIEAVLPAMTGTQQLATATMPLCADCAEFAPFECLLDHVAIGMYQLNEETGKREGQVRSAGHARGSQGRTEDV